MEEYYGVSTFVAHDDIEVSAIWRDEIENALRNCSAVIALLSEAFIRSTWANQKMGYASALGKTIIPFKLGTSVNPYGFFDKWQAKPLEREKITQSARSVVEVMIKNGTFPSSDFLKLFKETYNWATGAERSQILILLELSTEQVHDVAWRLR